MKRTTPLPLLGSALSLLAGCNTFPSLETPVIKAAHEGRAGTIKVLLRDGSRPDERDSHGLTALGWAARGGHPLRPHHCTPQDEAHLQAIRALLKGGADINALNKNGWTPLMVAIHHKQSGAALAMVDAGAHRCLGRQRSDGPRDGPGRGAAGRGGRVEGQGAAISSR